MGESLRIIARLPEGEKIMATGAPSAQDLLYAGEAYFALGNFRGTDHHATRAVESFPDDINASVLKCRALMALGLLGPTHEQALESCDIEITDENHIEVLVTILGGLMEASAA